MMYASARSTSRIVPEGEDLKYVVSLTNKRSGTKKWLCGRKQRVARASVMTWSTMTVVRSNTNTVDKYTVYCKYKIPHTRAARSGNNENNDNDKNKGQQ